MIFIKNIYDVIKLSPLFNNISYDEFLKIEKCFSLKTIQYNKNDTVIMTGDEITSFGLVLSGSIKIQKEDFEGNTNLITNINVCETFGEVLSCAGIKQWPVTVTASEKSEILFIDFKKHITSCSSACSFHNQLIDNMLRLIATKNLFLNQKNEILSKRTTREKLMCFFEFQRKDKNDFTIPFNREELASYLCVDRSAMSSELGRMRDEGLIDFHKNSFKIL